MNTNSSTIELNNTKKAYTKPELKNPGTLAELTQGFAGSIPDEQGGHTKRNPFQG
jgi:hypothetical protein